MKLAVDTHHLFLEHAGTKRVTINLLEEFKQMPHVQLKELKPSYSLFRGTGLLGKIMGHAFRFFWVHIHLPVLCFTHKVDILLSPEFNTPMFTSCKRAVIAHDAHMRAQKEYTSSVWFYAYYIPFIEWAIRRADLILTVSNFAKQQTVELMRLDERKVEAVHLGVGQNFINHQSTPAHQKELCQQGLDFQNYILFVGTFEARKNIERLIEAFAIFKKKNEVKAAELKLAIIGKAASGKFSDRSMQIDLLIQKLNLEKEVVLCGFISDAALPHFYKGARLLAFPSLHEGFGLPIIEGFASQVPVLTSDTCSMPEVGGNAVLLVDPYQVQDIADKLERLVFDLPLREQLISNGKQRVEMFTWKTCADKMVAHLSSVLK